MCENFGSEAWESVGMRVESWEWTDCPEDSREKTKNQGKGSGVLQKGEASPGYDY